MTAIAQTATVVDYPESRLKDYFLLLKPRVMSLVIFSGFAGMYVAPGHIHPFIGLVTILCIALGSGAAGAINMWYERDTDALMRRTANRPIPAGRISPQSAIEFASVMAFASVFIMLFAVNVLSAALLLFAILFYVFVYTMWLKRNTPHNIVIGGIPGAIPPMIGWAAVTGNITVEPFILFLIIFMWTPPHFWAIALYRHDDYRNAGIPMLPVVKGEHETKKQMLIYTLLLVPITLLPTMIGMSGYAYGAAATILGGIFLYYAVALYRQKSQEVSNKIAFKMFKFSVLYMFLIFTCLILDYILMAYAS